MFKKMLCALMSLVLLAGTAAVAFCEETDGVQTRFWDDMEEWKSGKYANAKAIDARYASAGAQVEIVENSVVPEMGKSLYVENTFFATEWNMTQPAAIKLYADVIAVSFRMVLVDETSSCLMYAHVDTDDVDPADKNFEGAFLRASTTQGILTGGAGYKLCDAKAGTAYDITALFYSNGGAPNVCRYEVYVDGEKRTPMPMMLMAGTGNATPGFMRGLCFLKTEGKKLLLDDIEVKGGTRSQIEALLAHKVTNIDPEQAAAAGAAKKRYDPELPVTCRFSDTAGCAQEEAILYLTQLGVFSRNDGGQFYPQRRITRAELAVSAARLCGYARAKYRGAYIDVRAEQWFATAIQGAFDCGMLAGMSDRGYFYPDAPADLADVLAVAVHVRQSTGEIIEPADLSGYLDYRSLPAWAGNAVAAAAAAELIDLPGITIGADRSVTRAEAAQILMEAYRQI